LVSLGGQDDGNVRVGVTASCTSSAWTAVVATRASRRLLNLKASDSNGGIICLGTDDAGGTCSTAQLGYELGTGDEYSDASEAPLYCRSGTGTQVVKGFDLYDNRDTSAD